MAKAKDDVMVVGTEGVTEEVGKVVEKKTSVKVGIDTTGKEVLKYIQEGRKFEFDPDDLPDIEKEVLDEMPYSWVQKYLKAKKDRDDLVLKGGVRDNFEIVGMLGTSARKKMKLRPRRGYRQTWIRPDMLDDAKEAGYVNVRRAKTGKNEKPGEESDEIIVLGPRDTPELIAMEIPEHRYKAHLVAVSQKSKRAYQANKDGFKTAVENVKRSVGNDYDVNVVDDEKDVSL